MHIRKAGFIFFWILSMIALLWVIAFGWSLRDGFGPDSVESHGLPALEAMLLNGIIGGLAFLVAPLMIAGSLLYPRKYKRGMLVFFSACLGTSICTFASVWIFQQTTPSMDLYNRAIDIYAGVVYGIYVVFGMYPGFFTLEWWDVFEGVIAGAIIGAVVGWRLTRNHNPKVT